MEEGLLKYQVLYNISQVFADKLLTLDPDNVTIDS